MCRYLWGFLKNNSPGKNIPNAALILSELVIVGPPINMDTKKYLKFNMTMGRTQRRADVNPYGASLREKKPKASEFQ